MVAKFAGPSDMDDKGIGCFPGSKCGNAELGCSVCSAMHACKVSNRLRPITPSSTHVDPKCIQTQDMIFTDISGSMSSSAAAAHTNISGS